VSSATKILIQPCLDQDISSKKIPPNISPANILPHLGKFFSAGQLSVTAHVQLVCGNNLWLATGVPRSG